MFEVKLELRSLLLSSLMAWMVLVLMRKLYKCTMYIFCGQYYSNVSLQETVSEDLVEAKCQVQIEHKDLV